MIMPTIPLVSLHTLKINVAPLTVSLSILTNTYRLSFQEIPTMTLNWDDMRIFLAVAPDGRLSAAAHHLKGTQPTAWHRLGQLEADLGACLFE